MRRSLIVDQWTVWKICSFWFCLWPPIDLFIFRFAFIFGCSSIRSKLQTMYSVRNIILLSFRNWGKLHFSFIICTERQLNVENSTFYVHVEVIFPFFSFLFFSFLPAFTKYIWIKLLSKPKIDFFLFRHICRLELNK